LENIRCVLCDSDRADLFLEDEGYKAVKCGICGLVYVNPRPQYAELKVKYNDGSLIEKDIQPASIEERCLKAKLDLALIKKYKKSGKMLDIGCAEGTFLSEASKAGYEPYGAEINRKFVEYARNSYKLSNIFECDILGDDFTRNFPEGYFDIICMRNVLSHLYDPIKELNRVNRVLKQDGIFMCVTGNLGDLSIDRIRKYSCFISPHLAQHLFHYSESNISSLFGKTGFHIKKICRLSTYLDECNGLFLRAISCIFNKGLSIKILAFVRVALGWLIFKKGRWLSLVIVASKANR